MLEMLHFETAKASTNIESYSNAFEEFLDHHIPSCMRAVWPWCSKDLDEQIPVS